jgi:hypothetical protein
MQQRDVSEEEIQSAEQAFTPEKDIAEAEREELERQRPATEDEIKEAEKD